MSAERDEEQDELLPLDGCRKCGRCGEEFWSAPQRKRPTFTSLFCQACESVMAIATADRDRRGAEIKAARKAARRAVKLEDIADEMMGAKNLTARVLGGKRSSATTCKTKNKSEISRK